MAFSLVGFGLGTRATVDGGRRWMDFRLLTVAVAGTWLPLVRRAARWGVHGHAFASLPLGL
ncbi:MAG: hypothetical protein ACRDWA_15400 [Acidimicrobiia bacterium]